MLGMKRENWIDGACSSRDDPVPVSHSLAVPSIPAKPCI